MSEAERNGDMSGEGIIYLRYQQKKETESERRQDKRWKEIAMQKEERWNKWEAGKGNNRDGDGGRGREECERSKG